MIHIQCSLKHTVKSHEITLDTIWILLLEKCQKNFNRKKSNLWFPLVFNYMFHNIIFYVNMPFKYIQGNSGDILSMVWFIRCRLLNMQRQIMLAWVCWEQVTVKVGRSCNRHHIRLRSENNTLLRPNKGTLDIAIKYDSQQANQETLKLLLQWFLTFTACGTLFIYKASYVTSLFLTDVIVYSYICQRQTSALLWQGFYCRSEDL